MIIINNKLSQLASQVWNPYQQNNHLKQSKIKNCDCNIKGKKNRFTRLGGGRGGIKSFQKHHKNPGSQCLLNV